MRSLLLRANFRSKRFALGPRSYTALNRQNSTASFHDVLESEEYEKQEGKSPHGQGQITDGQERQRGHQIDFIENPELISDPLTWNKLYRSAKEQNRNDGVRSIWRTFTSFPVHKVPVLYNLDIWKDLNGGELIEYMRKLNDAGIKPPKGSLKKIGLEYHNLEFISATKEELIEAAILGFDVNLPRDTYNTLIPKLCAKGSVDQALAWHRKLVSNGDPPRKAQDVERLRQTLIDKRRWAAALEVKKSVVAEDVNIVSPSIPLAQAEDEQRKALQSFVSKLDERVGITLSTSLIEDHTCARFFATSFFSVEFIMEGMSLFGMTKFGSLAIREIVKRTIRGSHCDTDLTRSYFARMHKLGLDCETRFGRLLEHLSDEGKEVLLYSIVTSDFHPDLYDDLEFQESLLRGADPNVAERTRAVLCFEMKEQEPEIRNILLRAGLENIELMVADGVPITFKTRATFLDSIYINRMPWISESKLRALTRIFLRLPYVTAPEWKRVMISFLYILRPHLRRDFEALLFSIPISELFDYRMMADIIRWYLRLGSIASKPTIETMLGGVRVLAALRDQGNQIDIHGPCEANLMSLFGESQLGEHLDMKKRNVAQKLGNMEDFITGIREIWGSDMWPGMSPSEIKQMIFETAKTIDGLRELRYDNVPRPRSHTGAYNPGRVKYLRDQAKINDDTIIEGSLNNTDRKMEVQGLKI